MVSFRAMVVFVIASLFGGLFLQGCGGGGGGDDNSSTIPKIAGKTSDLSTLVSALKTAGLVDTLSGKGPFTVFAPTNAAFSALPASVLTYLLHNKAALTKVLEYHVASGSVLSSDLKNGEKIKTLEGADVNVTITKNKDNATTVMINKATVTTADVKASNGVVHIINQVLIPPGFEAPTIPEVAASANLTTLVTAVKAAKLASVLSGAGPFTVFAPTDAAFNNLPKGVLANLLKPENIKDLVKVLEYHVVSGEVVSTDLKNGEHVKTLEGQDVNVTISGSTVSINKAKVTKADVYAGNGVVHVIDAVLLPPSTPSPAPPAPTPPAPTPPTPQTCNVMEGVNCDDGENIGDKPAKSEDECCSMCVSAKGCTAWTWNKKVSADPQQTCYMKKNCAKQSKKDGVVSGTVKTAVEVLV